MKSMIAMTVAFVALTVSPASAKSSYTIQDCMEGYRKHGVRVVGDEIEIEQERGICNNYHHWGDDCLDNRVYDLKTGKYSYIFFGCWAG